MLARKVSPGCIDAGRLWLTTEQPHSGRFAGSMVTGMSTRSPKKPLCPPVASIWARNVVGPATVGAVRTCRSVTACWVGLASTVVPTAVCAQPHSEFCRYSR